MQDKRDGVGRIAGIAAAALLALLLVSAASRAQAPATPVAPAPAVMVLEEPSFFDFLSPGGLATVARYCAVEPPDKASRWMHDFMCNVRVTDVAIATYAGLLVLVIVGLVLVVIIQYDHAARTAHQQLRAYVLVEAAFRSGSHDNHPEFQVTIKNFGQTPAQDVEHWLEVWAAPKESDAALPRHRRLIQVTDAALGPGASFALVRRYDTAWEPDRLAAFMAGDIAIYVYGEIRYRDVFRKRRQTRFRAMYALDNFATGALTICAKGNQSA